MITIEEIEKTFKEKSWWAMLFDLLPAKYTTYVIANYTRLTPNQVTFASLLCALLAGIAFYRYDLVTGAILYQISYILDIVDGSLARVTGQTSRIGAFFDVVTDWMKGPLVMIVLLWRTGHIGILIVILYLLFFSALVNKYNDMLHYTQAKSLTQEVSARSSRVGTYLRAMKERGILPYPGMVEYEGMVLFLFPVFGWNMFLYLAITLLVVLILLTLYAIYKKIT